MVMGCHRGDDGRVAELGQRVSVLEARLAALDQPPPAEWDDGCLTRVQDAVATARLFRTLDELILGKAAHAGPTGDRFACVSDLTRQNLPAVAKAQTAAKKAGAAPAPSPAASEAAPGSSHVWDPSWQTRRAGAHGCWDETAKRWETDDVHRPQDSALKCQLWCRANPCTWKAQGQGAPVWSAAPPLMAQAKAAGLELGAPLTCLVTDVVLAGRGRGFQAVCRTLGLRGVRLRLPAEAGAAGGPLATVNLGDLVRVKSYGRITAADGGPWVVDEIASGAVSIAERSSCCADPSSLAPPTK